MSDALEPYWEWLSGFSSVVDGIPDHNLAEFGQLTQQHWSLQGAYIRRLADMVWFFVGRSKNPTLDRVEIGLLPSWEHNACVASDSDGAAIFLNFGFVCHQRSFWKAFLGYASANQRPPDPEPLCPHLSVFDFLVTMANEVSAIVHPELRLAPLSAHGCNGCGPTHWEGYSDEYIGATELFVLLHEVGHLALGHLEHPDPVPVRQSRSDEFAADDWAMATLLAADKSEWRHRTREDAAAAAGVFLAMVELMEVVGATTPESTHPAASLRRQRINRQCDIIQDDLSIPGCLDSLVRGLSLIVLAFEKFLTSLGEHSARHDLLRDRLRDVEKKETDLGGRNPQTIAARREFWAALLHPIWDDVTRALES